MIMSNKESSLPLLENKLTAGNTTIYVCVNKDCHPPTNEIAESLTLVE